MNKCGILIGSFFLIFAFSGNVIGDDFHFPIDTINQTLNYVGIDTSDVAFRTDWVDVDSFRLKIVNELTLYPLRIPDYIKKRGDFLMDSSVSILEKFDSLALTLNTTWMPLNNLSSSKKTAKRLDAFASASPFPAAQAAGGIAAGLNDHLRTLLLTLAEADAMLRADLLSPLGSDADFLSSQYLELLREDEKSPDYSLERIDSLQKMNDSLTLRFKSVGPKINMRAIISANRKVVAAYQELAGWIAANRRALVKLSPDDVTSLFPITPELRHVCRVGGKGNDNYEDDCRVIIDLGGNDQYLTTKSDDCNQHVIIDCSGDDRYIAQGNHCFGAGFLGCGILDDWRGNDTYLAKNYSLGCGIFGTGILLDRAGDDTYIGDIGCQAASSFGVGMLLDYGGRDNYSASLYSQGFAFIMGSSALVDCSGNDRYAVGWKYGDILRYEDHYISLSQGFGYGLRPDFSGGVGLLIDGVGNDSYNSDIFGQGASYWWSLGGLLDYGGNDQYISYQYAQGNGTHLSLGALIDISGDDLYSAKGVSQGCGHDLAYGLLLDCAGSDQYNAFDLSQAAGSANGIGMLIDLKGDDAYMARAKTNTHGYGNPRREFGSIGLLLDLDGKDFYRGYGADDSYWVTQSKWGIGADLNSVKPDTAKAKSSGK